MRGAPFELRVWAALRRFTWHDDQHGAIAKAQDAAGASRAVGHSQRRESSAIIVPCTESRVVRIDDRLTAAARSEGGLIDHERDGAATRSGAVLNHESTKNERTKKDEHERTTDDVSRASPQSESHRQRPVLHRTAGFEADMWQIAFDGSGSINKDDTHSRLQA